MATQTLFDLTLDLIRKIGGEGLTEGVATGGSTTTLVDAQHLSLFPDDYFNRGKAARGSLWIVYDAGAAGAAPEKEMRRISDFVKSTTTLTVDTAFSVAPASGDWYAAATGEHNLQRLIMHINRAIRKYYPRKLVVDTSSITAATSTLEYTLPATDIEVIRVERITNTTTNAKTPITNWKQQKTATGSADKLVFDDQPPVNYGIELTYTTRFTPLRLETDSLDEGANADLIVARAAFNLAGEAFLDMDVKMRKNAKDYMTFLQGEMQELEQRLLEPLTQHTPRVRTLVNRM